jgi:ribosomal protein S18 acetylase RimI-like enzyme
MQKIKRKLKAILERFFLLRTTSWFILLIVVVVLLTIVFYKIFLLGSIVLNSDLIKWLNIYGKSTEQYSLAINIGEVMTAIAAASIIIVQLKQDQKGEIKHRKTAEAQFMLEYNKSFIENKDMCMVEHYLEQEVGGDPVTEMSSLREQRQIFINYLVYLEGMASCVHQDQLAFESIDDVFAYRFFIAVNNPEVQSLELVRCAQYYRGCFRLYEEWVEYRESTGKYKENYAIPLEETSLDRCKDYELYIQQPVKVYKEDGEYNNKPWWLLRGKWSEISKYEGKAFAVSCGKVIGVMSYSDEDKIYIGGLYVKPRCNEKLVKRVLLKEVFYRKPSKEVEIVYKDELAEGLLEELKAAKKKTEKYELAEEKIRRDSITFRQFDIDSCLSGRQMREIAGLIYDTDRYIYQGMFGSRQNAIKVIPTLLSGNEDRMFRLSNLYAAVMEEEIVGLILWVKGKLQWNPGVLCEVLRNLGIESPEYLNEVYSQYLSRYDSTDNYEKISLLNVCVDRKKRNTGIGRRLLMSFLEKHPKEDMELCVLKDNEGAVKLYQDCGFLVVEEYPGFSTNPIKPKAVGMTRVSNNTER